MSHTSCKYLMIPVTNSLGQPQIDRGWYLCVVAYTRGVWLVLLMIFGSDAPSPPLWIGIPKYVLHFWVWFMIQFMHATIFLYMALVFKVCSHCLDHAAFESTGANYSKELTVRFIEWY